MGQMYSRLNDYSNQMKKYIYTFFILFVTIAFIASCRKDKADDSASYTQTPYQLSIPAGFPPAYISGVSLLTVEGVRLGRMLYHDPILSSNGLTCSSCHLASKSFSSPLHIHPNGDHTSVPAHVNLAWKDKFLWEGGLNSVGEVCMGDFEPEFFNTNMNDLVQSLKNHGSYPQLFYQAFNITDIEKLSHEELKNTIVTAAAQFIYTLVSSDSRYDKYKNQEYAPTQEEIRGLVIFNTEEGDCFHCHGSVLATDNRLHNNGLDEIPTGQNAGNFNFSHDSLTIGKFISPTLRNIELTAPYMHDGRYATLEEVVEFYDHGVNLNSPNVDPIMTKPAKINGLHLSAYDKQCLVAFLKMFTDTAFIHNPEYQSPF